MPSNGGEFSGWLDHIARQRVRKCVKIWKLFRIKRSTLEAAHAHLHDVRTINKYPKIPLERTTRLARSRSPIIHIDRIRAEDTTRWALSARPIKRRGPIDVWAQVGGTSSSVPRAIITEPTQSAPTEPKNCSSCIALRCWTNFITKTSTSMGPRR